MKRGLIILLAVASLGTGAAEPRLYKSKQEAEKTAFSAKDNKDGWAQHCVARGGTSIVSSTTREYNMEGDVVGGSSFVNITSHSGAVAAVPIGDFAVEDRFQYQGPGGKKLIGAVVAVSIQLSTGNTTPSEMVMQRAVENLTKNRLPLPAATGAKPGSLLSLLEAAKKRFGASGAKPRYDAPGGKVHILLMDCQQAKADDTYLPATPYGCSRDERIRLAKKLEKQDDKGGFWGYFSETEIVPEGSRHIPFDGAPADTIEKIY